MARGNCSHSFLYLWEKIAWQNGFNYIFEGRGDKILSENDAFFKEG